MKTKVFITAAIWGSKYTATFVDYNLATQLAPSNIPSMLDLCEITYQIITTKEDKQWLEQQPIIKRLAKHCKIQWDLLEDKRRQGILPQGASGEKYFFLSMLQNLAIGSAMKHDILIFNYADFIWAEGSMPAIIRDCDEETDALLSFCLPVDQDSGIDALKRYARLQPDNTSIISLPAREGASMAIDHLHREAKIRYWEGEKFTITPTYILWDVADEGLIIAAYHQTILAMRVRPDDPFYFNGILTNSLDGYYSAVLAANRRVKHATNSDDILVFSLYDTNVDSSIGGPAKSDWGGMDKHESLRDCLRRIVTMAQRTFITQPIEVRRRFDKPEIWETAKKQAVDLLETYHRSVEFDPALYNEIYNGGHASAADFGTASFETPSPLNAGFKTRMKRAIHKKLRSALLDMLIPRDIAFNGNFNEWTGPYYRYYRGIWMDLPARHWLGHFDGAIRGTYERSTIVPNKHARYSLMVAGAPGSDHAYVSQKIDADALLRARKTGTLTCSGYIRREGFQTGMVNLLLLTPHQPNHFVSYTATGNAFSSKTLPSPLIEIKTEGAWHRFELSCPFINTVEDINNGAMICFVISGITSTQDKLYFSQIRFEAGTRRSRHARGRSPRKERFIRHKLHALRRLKTYAPAPTIPIALATSQATNTATDFKIAATLLFEGNTKYLLEQAEQRLATHFVPLTLGEEVILDLAGATYFSVGILPESILNESSNPTYQLSILTTAERVLRKLVGHSPLYIEGQRALARNLWFQGKIDEAFVQFQQAEDARHQLIARLGLPPGEKHPVILPANCTHVIGLMGHLDAFIKRKQLLNDPRTYYLETHEESIVNKAFFEYWKPHLTTQFPPVAGVDRRLVQEAFAADWNWILPSRRGPMVHVHRGIAQVQQEWQQKHLPPLLTLSTEHQELLAQFKTARGIAKGDWFVCLHVRSAGFYGDKRNTAQDFRNTPIEDYYLAIKAVVDAGGWVIRMGDPSMPKLALDKSLLDTSRVIDYAHDSERSEALDVALCASCELFVSSPSGLHTVAHAFGRPTCYVNYPIYAGFPWHAGEIFIPKLYYSLSAHKILSAEEILSSNLVHADHSHLLVKDSIILFRNTPDEIAHTVMEALAPSRYQIENRASGEACREQFERLNQRYDRDIGGRLGLYFAEKHKKVLFP